ncbi:MAG: hypothetical protein Q8R76_09260 [Candidatus Omnitrophota bacterium]|nr:hypothetical protein [Candidatus Omnitrophota bacterium]
MDHLGTLAGLKVTLITNAFRSLKKRSRFEFMVLAVFFVAAAAGLYFFFHFSFRFFRAQEPFGPILIDETFYLFTFSLFVMLLISSSVSSYTSLFRSREIPLLASTPVEWNEIYFLKLAESLWYSSWAFLFVALPFVTAYGIHKGAGLFFPVLCFAFFIPFVVLTGSLGTLLSTLIIWFLPNRRRRRLALALAVTFIVFLFVRAQPSLIKEQGSIAGIMSGYLPHLSFAKNPALPSCWASRGILSLATAESRALMGWQDGLFYFSLLLSNALFFLIPSYSVATQLYSKIYLRFQDHGSGETARRIKLRKGFERAIDGLKWPPRPVMAFLEKDLKTFARDPAEWSQLIIFFGLLLLYFMNLRNLEFHVLQTFWKNVVFVLNTIGTYIVLSSFNMRFVFPMISLEGSRFWIIDLSPVRFSDLLLEKLALGITISTLLTLPLIFLSGWMLKIPMSRILFTAGLGFFVCFALTGMSVGFGAIFPNFKSDNPNEIISGFGGSLLLVVHLTYLAVIGLFLMLTSDPHALIFVTVAMGSILAGVYPIKLGRAALKKMEF